MEEKTSIRHRVESIAGVSRTWFEWAGADRSAAKVLVVEVSFDTDPNSSSFSGNTIEAIGKTYQEVNQEGLQIEDARPVIISGLRIVPARSGA
jgi:hypothetical protein